MSSNSLQENYYRYLDAILEASAEEGGGDRAKRDRAKQASISHYRDQLDLGFGVTQWMGTKIPAHSQVLDLFAEVSRTVGPLVLEDHISELTVTNHSEEKAPRRFLRIAEILQIQDRVRQVLMILSPEVFFGTLPPCEHVTLVYTGLAMPNNRVFVDPINSLKTIHGVTRDLRLAHILHGLGDSRRSLYVVEGYKPELIPEAIDHVESVVDQFGGNWVVAQNWESINRLHIGMILRHN